MFEHVNYYKTDIHDINIDQINFIYDHLYKGISYYLNKNVNISS